MPAFDFTRRLNVAADPDRAWKTITDVPRLVDWISVLESARVESELERYGAVLADRIGMFSLRADLDIRVLEVAVGERIRVRAEGEDRQVGSRIVVEAALALEPGEADTTVALDGRYEVTGRVATMGSSTIRRKAAKILDEFFASLQRELAS